MGDTITRRITPAGLLLAVLLFLVLPLATASCDVPSDSSTGPFTIGTSVSGADLVASREHLDLDGGPDVTPVEQDRLDRYLTMPRSMQILAIVTAIVMVAAAALSFVKRAALSAVAAAVAAGLLTVTTIRALAQLTGFAETFRTVGQYLPAAQGRDLSDRVGEVVHIGWGFWLTLTILVAISAANVVVFARKARASARQAPPGNVASDRPGGDDELPDDQ